jgi:penicillin amidase
VELLGTGDTLSPEQVAAFQADTTSRPARTWARFVASQGPFEGDTERARAMLAGWDGNLLAERPEPLLYAFFRRALMRELFAPVVGPDTWAWLTTDANPGLGRVAAGLFADVVARLPEAQPPLGRSWGAVLGPALAAAWGQCVALGGPDASSWRWGDRHRTGSRNPLSAEFPDAKLDPPSVAVGGDADTIRCAGYGISGKRDFILTNLSVYRQVVDFAAPDSASFVIPGGASGDSRSAHFADQLEKWALCERVPMNRLPEQAAGAAVEVLSLTQ